MVCGMSQQGQPTGAGRRGVAAGGHPGRLGLAAALLALVAFGLRGDLTAPALDGPFRHDGLPVGIVLEAVLAGLMIALAIRHSRAPRDALIAARLRVLLTYLVGIGLIAIPARGRVTPAAAGDPLGAPEPRRAGDHAPGPVAADRGARLGRAADGGLLPSAPGAADPGGAQPAAEPSRRAPVPLTRGRAGVHRRARVRARRPAAPDQLAGHHPARAAAAEHVRGRAHPERRHHRRCQLRRGRAGFRPGRSRAARRGRGGPRLPGGQGPRRPGRLPARGALALPRPRHPPLLPDHGPDAGEPGRPIRCGGRRGSPGCRGPPCRPAR